MSCDGVSVELTMQDSQSDSRVRADDLERG